MTNFNEKLDEVVRNAYSGEISWLHDELDGTSFIGESLEMVEKDIIDTKQALTSLIKELVEEAKPEITFSKPEGMPNTLAIDFAQRHLDEFERNILKALEEV